MLIERVENIAGEKVLVECANWKEKEKVRSKKGKLTGSKIYKADDLA